MRITNAAEAVKEIKDGAVLMFGGFMAVGTPEELVNAIVDKGVGNLTVICNDTGFPDVGVGRLIRTRQIARLYASHIGTNPETGQQMTAGEIEVTLMPQGTLAERIRAGGAGLGGVLSPTGIGTIVEDGKQVLTIDDRSYLLELPLKADYALLHARAADLAGNLQYHGTMRNFNPLMALAADIVIAEVDEIIKDSYLNPDDIHTPGILVDYLVERVK